MTAQPQSGNAPAAEDQQGVVPRLAPPVATPPAPAAPGTAPQGAPGAVPQGAPGAAPQGAPGASPAAQAAPVAAPAGQQPPAPQPPAAQAAPATPAALGRSAPVTAPVSAPVSAPSQQNDAATALGRAMPQSTDVGDVSISEPTVDDAAYQRASTEAQSEEHDIVLPEVLDAMMDAGASDLHLTIGSRPMIRVHGGLKELEEFPELDSGMVQRVMYAALTQGQRETFEEHLELDFSYTLPGRGRFRVNLYKQREALGAAFRAIPFEIKPLEELGIPPAVRDFAAQPRGFVLVTGPTGSGKSTTLASLIDYANETRDEHIMTVEDPIEFLHKHKKCLVNQREVGADTWSFGNALKHVLRQDPDIILVGEMRDLETIQVALTAAETGHLVFATLHTQDAAQTIDRMIDVFPPHQQQQVRQQLAGSLQGVVCQTLCKTRDGKGRAVATEVLVVTPAVRNLIREGKTHQIYSSMQAGAKHGMHTMDQHLAQLVQSGKISYETGVEKCHHLEDFNRLCGRG